MAPVRWHAVRSPLLVMLLTTMLGGCCAAATVEVTTDVAGDGPPAQSRTAQSDSRPRQLTEGSSAASPGTRPAPASTPSSSINATINRCREGCLEKHFVPDMPCSKTRACSTCWSRCSSSAAEQTLDRSTPEGSGRCQLQLTVQRMVRNESLVVADISWAGGNRTKLRLCPSTGGQCLVTWEVSGGGLMGNLLTESTSVQLSLWSDTNYRIQVTCRSKHANSPLVRSAPLTLNTSGAIMLQQRVPLSSTSTTNPVEMDRPDGELPWPNEIAEGDDDEALARELDNSGESTDTPSGKLHAWMVARDGENTLAILALFVAVLLALLALLTIAALVRWRPSSGDSTDHLDKDVLVENELIVHTRYGS